MPGCAQSTTFTFRFWVRELEEGQSSYLPGWVKKDSRAVPTVQIVEGTWPVFGGEAGQPRAPFTGSIELLAPSATRAADADARALRPSCGMSRQWTDSSIRWS